ncbi:MAG: LysE family translocator [Candidatus Thermoplasmatota archaeon]|nr:LysE family translocator [Candidatus Thermoplasmatota archaeon]MCL5793639.1 LysE family translocator [Candidatus Thermoplasmatota archaeon]
MNAALPALLGIALGLSLAGPPGPITAIMVRQASFRPFSGIVVGLGAMTADFILMVVVFVVGISSGISAYRNYIFIMGSFFFFYLAYRTIRSSEVEYAGSARGYLTGLTLGVVNPFQIGWWLTAGLSVYYVFGISPFFFLFAGIVVWITLLSELVYLGAMKYGPRIQEAMKIFSVATLTFFGILFLYSFISATPALTQV